MTDAERTEVGARGFEIMTSILEEYDDLYASLACTERLLAVGSKRVFEEVAHTMEEMQKDPERMMGLIDLLPINAFTVLVKTKPVDAVAKVERQMSISALITGHAFFESVVKDLLRLTTVFACEKWLSEIASRPVTFGEITSKGKDVCAADLFEKEIKKLALAGMPAIVSRLLSFCRGNVTTKSHFTNYVLDIDRLKRIDRLRHDYAHRLTKAPYSSKDANTDLRYLTITAIHLLVCLFEGNDLKFNKRPGE